MRIIYLICLLISCTLLPLDASAASRNVVGVIKRFECGDNCYLTISRSDGKLETGLCVAKACEPWNAEASMPKSFIGRRIKVSIGMGTQLDGNGNEVGRHESFDTIEFLDQAKKGTKAD